MVGRREGILTLSWAAALLIASRSSDAQYPARGSPEAFGAPAGTVRWRDADGFPKPDELRAVERTLRPALLQCDRASPNSLGLALPVSVVFHPSGRVIWTSSDLYRHPRARCVASAARRISVPPFRLQVPVQVTFYFY
jgi:hypothetical protein